MVIDEFKSVAVSPHLILNDVLYLPKLTFDLISIRQLTKDVKCLVNYEL